jgi:hypothetical protein
MSDFKRHIFWVCHYKDIAQFERVSSRWPFVEKATYESLTFEPLPIGPGDYVITSRFHPHLMAARAGAQGQYLAPGAYSTTKHNSVVELGSTFTKIDDLWIATSWKSDGSSNAKMTSADPARVAAKRKLWKDAIKPDPEATKKAKGKASARS